MAEVYSCEIKEWVRVNDEGLVRPAPSAAFKRQVSIDKETGNAVGDALSAANRWEVVQKGSQENAFVWHDTMVDRPETDGAVYVTGWTISGLAVLGTIVAVWILGI
jgi:hypothetical protein